MTSRNRSQKCVDCGTPVGIWALRCPACIGRRQAEKNAARKAAQVPMVRRCECGAVIASKSASRCRKCVKLYIAETNRERLSHVKFVWWYYGPPPTGRAITEPGW